MSEPTTVLAIKHDNGKPEVVGFFIIHEGWGDDPVFEKGKPRSPEAVMRWNSLYDAAAWVRERAGEDVMIAVMASGPQGQPTVWALTEKASKGTEPRLWRISYIGSYRYHSGRLVDPTVVGTDREVMDIKVH